MQTEQSAPTLELGGKPAQNKLAGRLFRLFDGRGRFFCSHAPIRITLSQLAEFMDQQEPGKKNWANDIDVALSAS
ncbi:MAG: hypothetical protein ACRD1H_03505, partial [Vicinamibacterales bacterium]